jgi:hypothetical protein
MMKDSDIERMMDLLPGEEKNPQEIAGEHLETDPHWRQIEAIARMIRQEPSVEPPVSLGERIMERVRAHRPSIWTAAGEALLRPRTASVDPLRALRSPVSGKECSFYFIMVGVFYTILGVILMIGLHRLGTSLVTPDWVRWQPQIALVTAGCMVAIGLYLLKDGKLALRMARIGALVYLGFALLNGIFVPLEWDIPVSAALSLLSTLVGVPTGIFLIRTILNYGKQYA